MKLEILLAALSNLECLFNIGFIIFGIASAVVGIFYFVTVGVDANDNAAVRKYIKPVFIGLLIFGTLRSIPSIDDLWHIRISLIKYELASPENVKSGAETITRIAHELEEKYLTNGEKK